VIRFPPPAALRRANAKILCAEQLFEKSVLHAAALMRLEEEPDEEAACPCGGCVAGCDGGQRSAQTTIETTTGTASATIQIEPEYRTKIKSYVTEHKIRPVET